MEKTTWEKYKAILSSPRFHQMALVFVLQVITHYFPQTSFALDGLSALLAGSVFLNTVDRTADKLSTK